MAAKKTTKKKAAKSAKKLKTFLVVYHMNTAAAKRGEKMRAANPEASAEGMKAWMTWAKNCGDGLVDLGSPLGNGVKVDPKRSVEMASVSAPPQQPGAQQDSRPADRAMAPYRSRTASWIVAFSVIGTSIFA
jgi:hypothetical protein